MSANVTAYHLILIKDLPEHERSEFLSESGGRVGKAQVTGCRKHEDLPEYERSEFLEESGIQARCRVLDSFLPQPHRKLFLR